MPDGSRQARSICREDRLVQLATCCFQRIRDLLFRELITSPEMIQTPSRLSTVSVDQRGFGQAG